MIKYIDEINNILNDFLKPFDCTAVFDKDFAYYSDLNTITYSLIVLDSCSKTFSCFTKALFPEINADIFLWSFLHELGHNMTEDDFDEDEWNQYRKDAVSCSNDYQYYNLPIEKAATAWAGEYMLTHTEEVAILWNKLSSTIAEFYEKLEG